MINTTTRSTGSTAAVRRRAIRNLMTSSAPGVTPTLIAILSSGAAFAQTGQSAQAQAARAPAVEEIVITGRVE